MNRRSQRGFSLFELMIVLAIILVISVLAIPSYLRARQSAYEASAVGFTHSVQTDQVAYRATHGDYATSFRQLPGQEAAAAGATDAGAGGSIDTNGVQDTASTIGVTARSGSATSTVIRNSYVFTMVTVSDEDWYMTAFPLMDRTGGLYVYADSTGALRSAKGALPPMSSDNLHAQ